ncbi:MAG: DUF5928 domain-containing protein [Pseudomonadota bacterium]
MARIAFLLMVHKDPERVVRQARALTAHGDHVVIHADARMAGRAFAKLREGLSDHKGIRFARRVRCGWGEWSLVAATLNMLRTARRSFRDTTHYALLSGDCYPTKSRGYLDRFLQRNRDYIEAHDFFDGDWIRTGLREDRLVYRHWFNERQRKTLFYASLNLQRWLGMSRPIPSGIRVHIGSQWWILRAGTVDKMMDLIGQRRDLIRFFRTTWIPDETFFQTLAAELVPGDQISGAPPTTLKFSDYGMPVVFQADHEEFLRNQPQPFARKITAHAADLQRRLLEGFAVWDPARPEGGAATGLYDYLAGRGRAGRRYARRFWEKAIAPRADAEILIVCAKLWHIGHQVEGALGRALDLRALGYVFDEDRDLPIQLGNLESGLYKRNQHRQAVLNLILDASQGSRLLLCVDPSRHEVIADLVRFAGAARILLVDRPLTADHLHNHAQRVALVHAGSGDFERREALRALRSEFALDAAELRERFTDRLFVNDLNRSNDDNATDIGHFLRVPRARAVGLAGEIAQFKT